MILIESNGVKTEELDGLLNLSTSVPLLFYRKFDNQLYRKIISKEIEI